MINSTRAQNDSIKLLIVVSTLMRGGTEVHLLHITQKLLQRGYHVQVFAMIGKGDLEYSFQQNGVEIITPLYIVNNLEHSNIFIKFLQAGFSGVQLWWHLLMKRTDIVHFFLPFSYLAGAPFALLLSRPKIVMSRRSLNRYQNAYPKIFTKIERWLHNKIDAISGNSQKVLEQLITREGATSAKTHLIYNGIATMDLSTNSITKAALTMREYYQIDKNDIVLVIVANLIPYKGHHDLLDAVSMLHHGNWRLCIAGKDNEGVGKGLQHIAATNNISKQVHFMGGLDDVRPLLQIADVGLLVSYEEGFANAILEYMAAGLPVVATDVGGNSEAIIDGACGFVVPPRTPTLLTKAIDKLLADRTLRKAMGKNARDRVQKHFSMEQCIDNYDRLYKSLL